MVCLDLTRDQRAGRSRVQAIQDTTEDALRVEEGSLYPALHRLENKEMIDAHWGTSEKNRQAKFYTLTPLGRRALRTEIESWTRFAAAIARVIHA
ncbi:MAG: PadR family transcriptional regulator [Gemmatimonadales bacterium]|nr:PadR family transcriptional regulator [Gemmatimonadales bacterium]MBA3554913.1 PadR family transcriptional regulator [Gemmatimonadales bacterium]